MADGKKSKQEKIDAIVDICVNTMYTNAEKLCTKDLDSTARDLAYKRLEYWTKIYVALTTASGKADDVMAELAVAQIKQKYVHNDSTEGSL